MPSRVCVIDLPGMSHALLKAVPADSVLGQWIADQRVAGLTPSWPAVTCSVQATLTTGTAPSRHGIISNGLPAFRSTDDQALVDPSNYADYRRQISFWEQSNQLLAAPRFWQDASGVSRFKTALLFVQNSMPGFTGEAKPAADIIITPKPEHGPDGKFTSLCWSNPPELVRELFAELGPFPLMNYWGPRASIASSAWIARAAAAVWAKHEPRLQWVYVPHLDYDLQRFGPASPQANAAVAEVTTALQPLVESVLHSGGKIVLLSEYAIHPVDHCVAPNRLLADAGLLATRETADGRLIDYEQSTAFAMVDHQIAHVYIRKPELLTTVRRLFEAQSGLRVVKRDRLTDLRLDHRRSGDLLLYTPHGGWMDYRWWTNPADAPSFARAIDIHRKPGYDPLELFWDPAANGISQDASLVHGSHGAVQPGEAVLVGDLASAASEVECTDVARIILEQLD